MAHIESWNNIHYYKYHIVRHRYVMIIMYALSLLWKVNHLILYWKLKTIPILLCKIYRFFSDKICCSAIRFCLHYTMIRINQLLQSVKVSVNIYILNNMPTEPTMCPVPVVINFSYITKLCYYSVSVYII
jgi:hypothetical protein